MNHYEYAYRTSVRMTVAMRNRLDQIVETRNDPSFRRADAIREALRLYLDEQENLVGSKKHFRRSLDNRITEHEHNIRLLLFAIMIMVGRLFAYIVQRDTDKQIDPQTVIHSALREAHDLERPLTEVFNSASAE